MGESQARDNGHRPMNDRDDLWPRPARTSAWSATGDNGAVSDSGGVLNAARRAFLSEVRRAVLVTAGSSGRLRPVPVCFAVAPSPLDVLWTPIDQKPKQSSDPRRLARVRDIIERPPIALLVDRWDEDWSRLAWLRLEGEARLLEPGEAAAAAAREGGGHDRAGHARAEHSGHERGEHATAVTALRERYPQYAAHDLERRPIIRIEVTRAVEWGRLEAPSSR